jgi:trehalose/maltose transport system substrate-binding protein
MSPSNLKLPRGLCRRLWITLIFFSFIYSSGCRHAKPETKPEPLSITFMDPEWSHDQSRRSVLSEANLREFEEHTGVRVKHLPSPESSTQQLAAIQDQFHKEDPIDVYGIDVVWSGLLNDPLLDLKPFFASGLSAGDPDVVAGYTVKGKVVAIPYHTNVSVLMCELVQITGFAKGRPRPTGN